MFVSRFKSDNELIPWEIGTWLFKHSSYEQGTHEVWVVSSMGIPGMVHDKINASDRICWSMNMPLQRRSQRQEQWYICYCYKDKHMWKYAGGKELVLSQLTLPSVCFGKRSVDSLSVSAQMWLIYRLHWNLKTSLSYGVHDRQNQPLHKTVNHITRQPTLSRSALSYIFQRFTSSHCSHLCLW